jgi:hypothetical protein
MTDKILAQYITLIWNTTKFRGSRNWYFQHTRDRGYILYTRTLPSNQNECPIQITIGILRTWIDNPAAAYNYVTSPDALHFRKIIAKYFLEHGI